MLTYADVCLRVPASHYSFDSRDKMPPALYEFVNQASKAYMCPHTAIYVFRTAIYHGYKMPPALDEFVNQESKAYMCPHTAIYVFRTTIYNGYKMLPALYDFVNQESNVHCLSLSVRPILLHIPSVLILLHIFIGQLQVGGHRECGVGVSAVQLAKPLLLLTKLNLCCYSLTSASTN
jgi:hypothetical protein